MQLKLQSIVCYNAERKKLTKIITIHHQISSKVNKNRPHCPKRPKSWNNLFILKTNLRVPTTIAWNNLFQHISNNYKNNKNNDYNGALLGLVLYEKKRKTIIAGVLTDVMSLQQFNYHSPLSSIRLGTLLLKGSAMNDCLKKRCSNLERAISRLDLITSHDTLVLHRAFSAH